MFNLILAMTKNGGIGMKNSLPWKCPEELTLFKEIIKGSILICGRKTAESIPNLNSVIYCISHSKVLQKDSNNCFLVSSLEDAMKECYGKKTFIIGGATIYNQCISRYPEKIDTIYVSVMKEEYPCDSFVALKLSDYTIITEKQYTDFTHYILAVDMHGEKQYLDLLKETLNLPLRDTRNSKTLSGFFKNFTFDLRETFPLLTTKKMFIRGIVEELLFFLRGETDTKLLEEKGINIWKGNTCREFLDDLGNKNPIFKERREGLMGPMYGYQWRFFNASYDEESGKPATSGVDQLKMVVDTIKNEPSSRRIIMTDFNPCQAHLGVLYPCHSLILQFYVDGDYLDMYCYNRSQDLFLGTPFNIASSGLLLKIVSLISNKKARFLHMGLGDYHIYESHIEAVKEQINRVPYKFCKVEILKELRDIKDIETLGITDFTVKEYTSHPSIKAEMIK